jgi:hypothetical protein
MRFRRSKPTVRAETGAASIELRALAGEALSSKEPQQRKAQRPVRGGFEMKQVMVRYEVKPERAAENEQLVGAVYA